jgi:hypothetical protein
LRVGCEGSTWRRSLADDCSTLRFHHHARIALQVPLDVSMGGPSRRVGVLVPLALPGPYGAADSRRGFASEGCLMTARRKPAVEET